MKKILIINNEKDVDDMGWIPIIKKAIREIEDVEFEVIHHSEITKDRIEEIDPDFLYLTGRVTYDWTLDEILNDYKNEIELIKTTDIPTLGVCAGHQLIAVAYGADFGKMVEVAEGEEDIREKGFTNIKIVEDNQIFNGLDKEFLAYQLHRDEVKSLPANFELLASTDMCKIQAMKHTDRDLYSVQFHPEQYNEDNQDGKKILENFLSIE